MSLKREVDVLDQDTPIVGQKYACISFLSPDKILKKKELFFYSEFLKRVELKQSTDRFRVFIDFLAHKHNHTTNELFQDYDEFLEAERNNLIQLNIEEEYQNFIDANENRLTEEFNKNNNFQTNVRGLKIRGSFETQKEAEAQCKALRQQDPNHDIFVGPVGVWMPWDPDAYRTGKVEYLEKELNTLMQEKIENEEKAKLHFDEHVKYKKRQAIEENKKNARKHNIRLKQNIDKDGTLYRTDKPRYDTSMPRTKDFEKEAKKKDPSAYDLLEQIENNVERRMVVEEIAEETGTGEGEGNDDNDNMN